MIRILDEQNSILARYVSQLRDEVIQRDPMRFRRNLERTGAVIAYEISKTLNYRQQTVVTPLGEAEMMLPMDHVTLWTAAVDEEMTVKSYIVPGIGDPGDLAYGKKL